jgi:hypothetical protein
VNVRTDTLVEMAVEMVEETVAETEVDEESGNGTEDVMIGDKTIDHRDATEIYLTIADRAVEVEAMVVEAEEDVIEEAVMTEDSLRNKERRVLPLHQRKKSLHQI